jgi:hypothetical protein
MGNYPDIGLKDARKLRDVDCSSRKAFTLRANDV